MKFSLIMPVYNTSELLLKAAVDSVLRQDYDDYELIIVDDGSEPYVAELCDKLALDNNSIRVYHQTNKGVSVARNSGIAIACGIYVMFVDSDDVLGEHTLRECAEIIGRTDADYVFGGIKKINTDEELILNYGKEIDYKVFTYEEIPTVKAALLGQNRYEFQNVSGGGVVNRGPYARAVRTSLAKQILFNPNLKIGEDVVWNMQVLNRVKSACFVNRIWYGYICNENSAIRKYYGNRNEILGEYIQNLYNIDTEFCEKYKKEFLSNMTVAFHTILKYDYATPLCPLSQKEKNKKIKEILQSQPWNQMLFGKKYLSMKHRIIVECSRYGCILQVMKLIGE